MSEKPKLDQEADTGCPEGQHKVEGKCVPKSDSVPPPSDVPQDDPYTKQLLIDSIKELGYTLSKDNCDSIASLKQLHKFAKANPKVKLDAIPEAPRIEKSDSEIKVDSDAIELQTLLDTKIDAADPEWNTKMTNHIDSAFKRYHKVNARLPVILKYNNEVTN